VLIKSGVVVYLSNPRTQETKERGQGSSKSWSPKRRNRKREVLRVWDVAYHRALA
jgi:hypothetical protein